MQPATTPTVTPMQPRGEIFRVQTVGNINPETVRLHGLHTVPVNEQTMLALQELCESSQPGRVHVINGAAVFLTDAEFAFHETMGVLEPENFDTLAEWRDHLQNHMNEMLIEAGELQSEVEALGEPTGEDMLSALQVVAVDGVLILS